MKKSLSFLFVAAILVAMLVGAVGVIGASAQSVCSPAIPVSVPFSKDGPGTFCYQATSMCNAINSWNMTSLQINGNSYTNIWVAGPSIPELNGVFTITYKGGQSGHFEIAGSCPPPNPTATFTRTPTPGPSLTFTRTPTKSLTPTITLTRTITPTKTGTLGSLWLGYGPISGMVTDASTGAPIAGALVMCNHLSSYSPVAERCSGTRTTGADGTYVFSNVLFYMTDMITLDVDKTGYGSLEIIKTLHSAPTMTWNFAMPRWTQTPTITRTPTPGPSLTPTKTLTRTITPSPTPTLPGGICAPVELTIELLPFVNNGVGTHCWRIASFGFINSFNTSLISVNGVNFTNVFASSGGSAMPPQIDGYWYITYVGSVAWSHFEIQP